MSRLDPEPLPLEPLFVERVWGGSGLAAHFGKDLPPGRPIGESWEAADVGEHVSPIASGPRAGCSLRDLIEEHGAALAGAALLPEGRLPLLFKLIDAREDLSVQLHPRDEEIPVGSNERGKEEAWYIVAAEPGARLVHGLVPGVAAGDLFRAIAANRAGDCLSWHEVAPGQVYYVPAGTVHAIGGGILLAEIQQSSDTTYRLYDWGRVGLDGRPRELHLEAARAVALAEPVPCPYGPVARRGRPGEPDLLVDGEHFRLRRHELVHGEPASGSLTDSFALLFTVEGQARLANERGEWDLERGATWLLPACMTAWRIETDSTWTGLWMEPVL